MDIAKIRRDARTLLEQLADRLTEDQADTCQSLSRAGELAELVDVMCAILYKNKIPVTQKERELLVGVLADYPVPVEGYDYINKRDEILAMLTVTPETD